MRSCPGVRFAIINAVVEGPQVMSGLVAALDYSPLSIRNELTLMQKDKLIAASWATGKGCNKVYWAPETLTWVDFIR